MSSTENAASPVFTIRNVSFSYERGADVLDDVSFEIASGEIVGIIGPNGAGKSTLLGLMNGLLRPARGSALLDGEEVADTDPLLRARRLGFVPQSPAVFFPYSVAEIVWMGRHPYSSVFGEPSDEDRERVRWAMETTDVMRFAGRLFGQLSGGEAQRVIIARALAQATPTLLLDEPTSSLDLYYQTSVYGLLERLNRETGLTVVIVTHEVNLAAEYCTRLIALREGRVLVDGSPAEVITQANIEALYGIQAEILDSGERPFVRLRHSPGEAPSGRASEK